MNTSKNYQCPFCNSYFVLDKNSYTINFMNFDKFESSNNWKLDSFVRNLFQPDSGYKNYEDSITVEFFKCSNCMETSIEISGYDDKYEGRHISFHPLSKAKQYPEYVPEIVREDYEEAYAILNLSPKASATLTRRCLQAIIRDFWEVKPQNLFNEIKEIEEKVDPAVSRVLHSLRQIGNIGAHPSENTDTIVDIEPGESEKMLKIVEYLIEQWYIKEHETELLLNEVNVISKNKKEKSK